MIHQKNKFGFTLIEVLMVITMAGVISVLVFSSFSTVSARIAFQNQATSLQYWADDIRSRTFTANTDGTEANNTFVYLIDLPNHKIETFKAMDSNYLSVGETDEVLDSLDFSDAILSNKIDIKRLYYYETSSDIPWMPLTLTDYTGKVAIIFKSGEQTCTIKSDTEPTDPFASDIVTMLKIPIYNKNQGSGTDPVKFGYVHKTACNLEILNDNI